MCGCFAFDRVRCAETSDFGAAESTTNSVENSHAIIESSAPESALDAESTEETLPQDGFGFLRTPASFMFRYDAAKSSSGDIVLYGRTNPIDAQGLESAENIDIQKITSTTLNPARYTQRIRLNELVEFLKSDWQVRNVSAGG